MEFSAYKLYYIVSDRIGLRRGVPSPVRILTTVGFSLWAGNCLDKDIPIPRPVMPETYGCPILNSAKTINTHMFTKHTVLSPHL